MNDITYFDWLCDIVGLNTTDSIHLAKTLYDIPYEWHFVMDENRAEEGLTLRVEFSEEFGVVTEDIKSGKCSVFEMLVALSRRMFENSDISPDKCYHEMIRNLGLLDYPEKPVIYLVIKRWMDGNFDRNGTGSPFVFRHHEGDARNLDLWNAMTIYISENYPLASDWLKE